MFGSFTILLLPNFINNLNYIITEEQRFTIRTTKDSTGGYSGRCLELPAAISEGETIEELMINMKEVIQMILESIEKDCPPNEKIIVTIPT